MKTFIKVIEIWVPDEDRTQLKFGSGLYGALSDFKNASEQQHFSYDEGLPGKAWAAGHPIVLTQFEHSYFKRTEAAQKAGLTCGIALPIFFWETGMPVLMENIGKVNEFTRAADAQLADITTGLGIPAGNSDEQTYVMTFLSAKATPIAKRIQIWIPESKQLVCRQGYSKNSNNLAEIFETLIVNKGEGALGRVWLTGMPIITGNQEADEYNPKLDSLSSMLAIPVIEQGRLKAIVTFLF
jgi:hypothetical protein